MAMCFICLGDDGFIVLPSADSFNTTAMLWKELQEELQDLQILNQTLSQYVQVCNECMYNNYTDIITIIGISGTTEWYR